MPDFDLLIRNATIVLPSGAEPGDVAVADERIVARGPDLGGSAADIIDGTGLHLFPGVIDPHVHFNEPGRTDWEGFSTGSQALVAGGGPLFLDMPLNSSPPTIHKTRLDDFASPRPKALWIREPMRI